MTTNEVDRDGFVALGEAAKVKAVAEQETRSATLLKGWTPPDPCERPWALVEAAESLIESLKGSEEWASPAAQVAKFALRDATVRAREIHARSLAADATDSTRKSGVMLRANTAEQGGGFSAWLSDGIPAVGTGESPSEAFECLASLLGDFVRGHGRRIEELEKVAAALGHPCGECGALLDDATADSCETACVGRRRAARAKV